MSNVTETLTADAMNALKEFQGLAQEQYLEVWKTLSAPPFAELDGEYQEDFPPGYSELHKRWQGENLYNGPDGYWIGKAYIPFGRVSGEGYNSFRMPDGHVERRVRYGTHLGASRVDGRLAVIMTYSSFNRDLGGFGAWQIDMVDEIRKLADGVYVGVGTHRLDALDAGSLMLEIYKSYGQEIKSSYELHERSVPQAAVFTLIGPIERAMGPDDPTAEDH
jgi:hypothetical protein